MAVQATTAEALVEEIFLFGRVLRRAVTTGDETSPLPQALTGVLATLATEGECRQTDLAGKLYVSQSALSRQVADLIDLGFIDRTPDPDDKRASLVRVSAQGHQKLTHIWERRATRLRAMLANWDEQDALDTVESIRRLNTTLDAGAQNISNVKLIAR